MMGEPGGGGDLAKGCNHFGTCRIDGWPDESRSCSVRRRLLRSIPNHMKITPNRPEVDALPSRISLAPPDASLRGVPFQGVEALLARHGYEKEERELRREFDLPDSFSTMTKYSLVSFLKYEESACKLLAEQLFGFDEAVYRCGAAAIEVFFATLAGRTMKALAGDNPHRLLASVPNGYELLASFGERRYLKLGPREGRFNFSDDYLGPVHTCGLFDAAVRELHGLEAKFELEESGQLGFSFAISW